MMWFKRTKRSPKVISDKDIEALYQHPRSITDWLPWVDFDTESNTFTMEDGVSAAVMFEITPVPTEARPDTVLNEIVHNIQTCINHTIPAKDNPFVLQCFVQDEDSLNEFSQQFETYIPEQHQETPMTQAVVKAVQNHLKMITNPDGFFRDDTITGGAWYGKQRRVRVFLYRRLGANGKGQENESNIDATVEINEVSEKFIAQLTAAGVRIRRCQEDDLHQWLIRWFNPKATITDGDRDTLLALTPCPPPEQKPFGYDLSSLAMLSQPVSDSKNGVWWFEDMPHRIISIDALRRKPDIGHLTGERKIGENLYAVFDKLPTATILSICVTIEPQDTVENRIVNILNSAKGETADAIATERDANRALTLMATGDYLLPTTLCLYVRGEDLADLQRKTNTAHALLLANGLHPIREKDEQLPLHTYIRQLPMNYEPAKDKQEKKARLVFSSDLAKLLPFYGRSRGTGHPGMIFFNRGAEPLCFDPLNKADRSKNAFGLVLGPPGSGKSSLMVYLLLLIIAVHKARVYIIEKGNSFRLLGQYCEHLGLSVNQVSLRPNQDVSLPPFADALVMLEREKRAIARNNFIEKSLDLSDEHDECNELKEHENDDTENAGRDYLGEMELKARVMITGGDPKEEAQMTRADRLTIRKAIVNAATTKQEQIDQAAQQGRTLTAKQQQVLTEDVVQALTMLSNDQSMTPKRRERAADMADAMELYCSGTAGHFFNRTGSAWPETDVTILEMGLLADEGYEDQLALGFMGLISQINSVVEREQYSDRPTFVLGDEAHLITTNPLLATYLVKIVKMWRKLGAWLWLATQNMEDFPDAAKKLLGLFEWWIAMVCPKEQIEQIARFKDLTDEQKNLLLAAHKEPGKYTEGVVMADNVQALFRNVPPPIALALAMTEKHEKRQRAEIMRQFNCTELEAVFEIAAQLVDANRPRI